MNMQEKTHNFFQILGFSIRKGRFSCSFLLKEKNQKFPTFWLAPDCICSFALMQKNQKIKAYTPEATNSHRSAKISETRFEIRIAPLKFRKLASLKQPKFLHAPLGICFTPLTLGQIHPSYIYNIWYRSW